MAIHEIYSKRQMRLRGEFNDVYQYEDIPLKLRVQVCKIYNSFFDFNSAQMNYICEGIYEILTTEYGVDHLDFDINDLERHCNRSETSQILISFAKKCAVTDCFLDVLELLFFFIRDKQEKGHFSGIKLSDVIEEINIRFRESSVGYQLDPDSLTVIRVDSQFVHSEVVKPTLTLLNADPAYAGSLNEFMTAHDHYRHSRYREAISSCGNSFESMLKAIHEKRGWDYEKGKATASPLIDSCSANGLFPEWQKGQPKEINNILKSILRTGVPKIRNEKGSHGHGVEVIEIPEHLASYMIHLTATNLLFLANSDRVLG